MMKIPTVVLAAVVSIAVPGCDESANTAPAAELPAVVAEPAVASSGEPGVAPSEDGWPAVIVAERNLFVPEGVEFDRTRARFLVGSLRDGTVYQLERDGRLTPVAEDPELVSSIGIEVDEPRDRLLVANSDWSVFTTGGVGHAKLGVFDLSNGERIAMVDLGSTIEERTEDTTFFANDITVDDRGTIYITDTRTGAIYRVDDTYEATLLHRFVPSETFRPNGIVYHPSGYLLVVGGESMFKVPLDDPASARQVALTEPIPGADGAVWTNDEHLAIVANRANRVVVLMSLDEWASAELVGSASYEVMATTVAVVGDELYVVHPHFRDEGVPSVERVTLK